MRRGQDPCTQNDGLASVGGGLIGGPAGIGHELGHEVFVFLDLPLLEQGGIEGEIDLHAVEVVIGDRLFDEGESLGPHLRVDPVEEVSPGGLEV